MDQKLPSRFCVLPWTQLCSSTDGTVLTCCRSRGTLDLGSLNKSSIHDIWHSEQYKKLRDDIKNNLEIYDCQDCFKLEEIGIKSVREMANEDYRHLISHALANKPEIKSLELRLSNICNYKCKTCGPRFSSSWIPHTETPEAHSITSTYGSRNGFLDEIKEILPSIESLYFAGGEPLLHADHYKILDMLIENKQFDCKISYNTNFSVTSLGKSNIYDYWKKFNNVKLNISLDGSHERGNYIRTGFNWEKFKENFFQLKNQLPNIQIEISYTLSILNIYHTPDFFLDLLNEKIIHSLSEVQVNYLEKPEFYHIGLLNAFERSELELIFSSKEKAFSKSFNKIESELFNKKLKSINDFLQNCSSEFERKKFSAAILKVDKSMHGNFLKIFPELNSLYLDGIYQISLGTSEF
jgi:MoaA/NifB/PqqE/SkfB family radical SAM enzyme